MTRGTKAKASRPAPGPESDRRLPTALWILGVLGLAGLIAVVALLWPAEDPDQRRFQGGQADPGPVHVHGLGIDPDDGALFIATHTGLYRVDPDERKASRVGNRLQDTMGFTIVGPNRFLGSGHPDFNEARAKGLPPLLGLIESTDDGKSWTPVSLLGEADFHVLRFGGGRVYGYDASHDRLLASSDDGQSWEALERPAPLIDLAVNPRDSRHLVAAAASELAQGMYASRDGGRHWSRIAGPPGLLGWPVRNRLYLVSGGGLVFVSPNAGRVFEHVGQVGGEPAALLAHTERELFVALHDGTIKSSTDGGKTWLVRSTP